MEKASNAWSLAPRGHMRAAHIFPCRADRANSYGRDADNREEFMDPGSGLGMCEEAEKKKA